MIIYALIITALLSFFIGAVLGKNIKPIKKKNVFEIIKSEINESKEYKNFLNYDGSEQAE